MKLIIARLLSYIPRQLPVGKTEFENWSDRVLSQCGKYADPDSMKFALCSQIMHLGSQQSKVSDQFFIRSLRKAAANQVASQFFQDIKNKQLEAQKAAQQQAEAPAQPTIAANEQGQTT